MGRDILDTGDQIDGDLDLSTIEINHDYARRLEHNKKREALHRLEDLHKRGLAGDSDSDSDSSSSSDDDDPPEEDLQLLKALNKIKKNDPVVAQKDAVLFPHEATDEDSESDSDEPPEEDLEPIKALNRIKHNDPAAQKDADLFPHEPTDEDSGGDEKPKGERKKKKKEEKKKKKKEKPMYLKDVNAQRLIEKGADSDDDDELPLKHNAKIYDKKQADGIKAFLTAEKEAFASDDDEFIRKKETADEGLEDEHGEIQKELDEYFGDDENLDEDNKFLKEYLGRRMWLDKGKDQKQFLDEIDVSEDEDELEKQEQYEAKYNFRHEEAVAQGDRVLGHSRIVEGSVRKKPSKRAVQRKNKEDRMALVEHERKEELKQLKNLKKKEIQEKLEKIRAVAGIGDDGACILGKDDLEEEFNPEEYDRKMKEAFGDGYYDAEDADPGFGSEDEADLEKPDFDKEDELLGIPKGWDDDLPGDGFEAANKKVQKQKEMVEEEEPEKEEGKRKRKRNVSLKEKMELDKELEEYYKLDYEGTVGDLKTRFKYRSVPANKYGLKSTEILMANDKDLNQYVSLKKLATYREDEWKVTHHQKLKKDLILHGVNSDAQNLAKKFVPKGDRSSAVERKSENVESNGDVKALSRSTKRRHRQAELKLSHSRLLAYGKISKTQKAIKGTSVGTGSGVSLKCCLELSRPN